MANSYANNQWFNLDYGVAGGPLNPSNPSSSHTEYDNPKFMFPGPVRRNLGGGADTQIQRGFIRSLLPELPGVTMPSRRMFFQFNPTQIMRSVSVSTGMMNPLLQDPSQFSVATPGNATFSFELILNREMEVNAGAGTSVTSVPPPGSTSNMTADQIERNFNSNGFDVLYGPNNPQAVGRLGVLSDLMILDTIIGQGISQDTIDALSKIYNISSTWDSSDTSSGASVTATGEAVIKSEEDARSRLSTIIGNSAFLVSTPVRIVFSSLFMIDGFIQSSSVLFSKFNNAMIPTMCTVNIIVEAKYIGFAKKDTYLTEALRNARVNPNAGAVTTPETSIGDENTVQELVDAIKTLPIYQIAVGGTKAEDHPDHWNDPRASGAQNGYDRLYEICGQGTSPLLCRFGFKHDLTTDNVRENISDTSKVSTITKWFYNQEGIMSISHSARVRVYRSFIGNEKDTTKLSGVSPSGQEAGPGSAVGRGNVSVTKDVLLLDIQSPVATASNFSEWQNLHAYGGGSGSLYGVQKKAVNTACDNATNSVFAHAQELGKSAADAYALYTQGASRVNAGETIPIVIEITLLITVTRTAPGSTKSNTVVVDPVFNYVEDNSSKVLFKDLSFQSSVNSNK